jgi:hypothetical protein
MSESQGLKLYDEGGWLRGSLWIFSANSQTTGLALLVGIFLGCYWSSRLARRTATLVRHSEPSRRNTASKPPSTRCGTPAPPCCWPTALDVKTVAERMGHDPAILLRVYAHAIKSADKAAAERLDTVLG